MRSNSMPSFSHRWLLLAAFVLTAMVYWPGLSGGFLFDDYPNIVDNQGVQPKHADMSALINAALSSPSSEFKRPLASLSFALNYLASGLDPYWMKLTNLVFHLLNGLLVFLLAQSLMYSAPDNERNPPVTQGRENIIATLIAASWMLLPINLTGVLYVVQRMESLANLFVLIGLLGYIAGRRRMLIACLDSQMRSTNRSWGLGLCAASLALCTATGTLAKETAVMLPLYAFLIEWLLFGFRKHRLPAAGQSLLPDPRPAQAVARDRWIIALYFLLLVIPMVTGVFWLLPGLLSTDTWANRDFTMATRLLSEARVVSDYVIWILLPTPGALSFYHDYFVVSTGLLTPWTTPFGIIFLVLLATLIWSLRQSYPLVALGLALFLGCQLLTGTILPLELVYEHRNYFASFGLLLAVVPLLAAPPLRKKDDDVVGGTHRHFDILAHGLPMPLARYALLGGLILCWTIATALTAYAWGNPLRLAEDLATRAPYSPRSQYELGRTYIIYSHYDPASPFTKLAYAPLEKSAALPQSSILPEQALIFMNSRMHLPLKEVWWDSMITKLTARRAGVQDESSLGALTQCEREKHCELPKDRMTQAYLAALTHPNPSARLLAMYGDYAWNVQDDHALGEQMIADAVKQAPHESAYRISLVRMLVVQGRTADARAALAGLQALDIGGNLDSSLQQLRDLPGMR